jgi:hypothetical protein
MLRRLAQSIRAVLHFGPWRNAARAIIRRTRPPHTEDVPSTSSLFKIDTARLLHDLRHDGIAAAGFLPAVMLRRIRELTDELPPGEYGAFEDTPDVHALCHEAADVARLYLDAEPELLECSVSVANREDPLSPITHDSDRHFHFEDAGWHSLSLFVYLTDVSETSGAREVVIGTHQKLRLWDAIRGIIPDDEIKNRCPNQIRTIIGPSGTMFFEDTSAIHRRRAHAQRYALLHILLVSRRSCLNSHRRLQHYSEFLRARPERTEQRT